MENINIEEILKDCPNGQAKVWCDAYGYAIAIVKPSGINIIAQNDNATTNFWVDQNGCLDKELYPDGTCIIWPSKDNHDWSTFKAPHKHFEPFQKVLRAYWYEDSFKWVLDLYSHYDEDFHQHMMVSGVTKMDDQVIPYEGNEGKLGKKVEND